jgi:hypothetical protein
MKRFSNMSAAAYPKSNKNNNYLSNSTNRSMRKRFNIFSDTSSPALDNLEDESNPHSLTERSN